MSQRLPTITAREMVRILELLGFYRSRQKGSHAIYRHSDKRRTNVPMHPGDLPRGTMKQILNDIQMSEEELLKLL